MMYRLLYCGLRRRTRLPRMPAPKAPHLKDDQLEPSGSNETTYSLLRRKLWEEYGNKHMDIALYILKMTALHHRTPTQLSEESLERRTRGHGCKAEVVRLGEHDYGANYDGSKPQDFDVAETVFYPDYKHPQ
ncbi:hypothetical protein GWK47_044782 [Chionoecetes opilio]|uniref:Uncharacterized protein n=1 Tax=Chionoecetes opilio TaxID=41210 RepID=A0A8J4Y7T7_CHIOP|nr:hypothetical protein GWK47_044782 [Chionoecetes opilio]